MKETSEVTMSYEDFLTVAFREMVRTHKVLHHSLTDVTEALGLELITKSPELGLAVVRPKGGGRYYSFRYKAQHMSELGFTHISVPTKIMQAI